VYQFAVHAMWDSVYLTLCISSISFGNFQLCSDGIIFITLLITRFVVSGHRVSGGQWGIYGAIMTGAEAGPEGARGRLGYICFCISR